MHTTYSIQSNETVEEFVVKHIDYYKTIKTQYSEIYLKTNNILNPKEPSSTQNPAKKVYQTYTERIKQTLAKKRTFSDNHQSFRGRVSQTATTKHSIEKILQPHFLAKCHFPIEKHK